MKVSSAHQLSKLNPSSILQPEAKMLRIKTCSANRLLAAGLARNWNILFSRNEAILNRCENYYLEL